MNTYRVGVHRNTVKEWDRTRPGGQRFHTDEDVDRDCGRAPRSAPQRMAVHGRVSSRAQRPAREAQPRARETFRPGSGMAVDDGLTAIGGGWHGQRPVFRALMERIARRDRSRLRVAPKDRPCRCGLDGCAYCAETHDCAIRVVHRESLSPQAERVEDPMAVVHMFSGRPACVATGSRSGKPPPMAEKVTRILHSQGLNRAKHDRLADMAERAGGVRADAWRRCSGVSTAAQSPYAIRDAWMAESCDWHGLPARLGKAMLADALGDIAAAREAAKVSVRKAIRHRTRGHDAERHGEGLGDLLAEESDARKVKGQPRNKLRDLEEKHRDKGHTRKADHIRQHNLGHRKWDRRQVRHRKQVRDHLCQAAHTIVDKAGTFACEDLSLSMQSATYRHKDTNRRLNGWVKGVMADTLTSISRRRGSALALVNPAYTSQTDSRTGLLQGTRRWDRFYCLDGVVLDADANAACNILARLYDEEITLSMPYRDVRALLAERTRLSVGTARPGLELRGRATMPPSTESELPATVPNRAV